MEEKPDSAARDDDAVPSQVAMPVLVDLLFRKYAYIWVWSIIFGANTGLAFSFLSIQIDRDWGPLGVGLVTLLGLSGWAWFTANLFLLLSFSRSILPIIVKVDSKPLSRIWYSDSKILKNALRFMLTAMMARFLMVLFELALSVGIDVN